MLSAGTTLGPYKILTPLGAGGMGEVFRARDTRLGRDVALKVISTALAHDQASMRRFEQEARAAGSLNHPNVCAVFDLGSHEGSPFVVMELLEGSSLRARLKQGPIPVRKAIDWAAQAAHGLAAAHAKGIVHRDLKPENLFLTKEGRVKVLDFGLAKLMRPELLGTVGNDALTVAATQTGAMLGTAGYMAPEQLRGEATDHRADLFALGAVLYELLTGKQAFAGETLFESAYRIVHAEPEPLGASGREMLPGVEAVVRRCLEKSPEERFQSAKDLAFDLESVAGTETQGARPAVGRTPRHVLRRILVAGLLGAALLAVGLETGRRLSSSPPPTFKKLSHGRGLIGSARFIQDGSGVLYSARWEDDKERCFSTRLDTPGAVPIEPADAQVVDIRGGEAAVLLPVVANPDIKLLAKIPVGGGTPRPIREGIRDASWSADGKDFAVINRVDEKYRLEYPPGNVLFESASYISRPRLSPAGDRVAFVAPGGSVMVVDMSSHAVILSNGWNMGSGGNLAWSTDGSEVWFCAERFWGMYALRAVTLEGKTRTVLQGPTSLALWDISREGQVLLSSDVLRTDIRGRAPGDTLERPWSWLDGGIAVGVPADGSGLLFTECASGGGVGYSAYFRRFDGSLPIRIGDGVAEDLSLDGKWAILSAAPLPALTLAPTGPGDSLTLPSGSVVAIVDVKFFPDAKRILIAGNEAGRPRRLFVQDVGGGDPRPFSDEGITLPGGGRPFSPDGTQVLVIANGKPAVVPDTGGSAQPIDGLLGHEQPIAWGQDGRSLFVVETRGRSMRVVRFDLESRTRTLWKELRPQDPAGALVHLNFPIAKDGEVYFYTVARTLQELVLVQGLR